MLFCFFVLSRSSLPEGGGKTAEIWQNARAKLKINVENTDCWNRMNINTIQCTFHFEATPWLQRTSVAAAFQTCNTGKELWGRQFYQFSQLRLDLSKMTLNKSLFFFWAGGIIWGFFGLMPKSISLPILYYIVFTNCTSSIIYRSLLLENSQWCIMRYHTIR